MIVADDFATVLESPDPERIFIIAPGILRLDSGRLVVTCGYRGPGMGEWSETLWERPGGNAVQGRIYTSDDDGQTWTHRVNFPFMHARPFVAGESVYVLGHANDLIIFIRSGNRNAKNAHDVNLVTFHRVEKFRNLVY